MTRFEKIKNILEEMETDDIVSTHNAYCDADNRMDDYIYSMEEFDDIMNGKEPWEIVRSAYFGDFNPTHKYFLFNGYGNVTSFDYWEDERSGICIDDIAEYIDREEDALDINDIQYILDGLDEEETE